MSLPCTSPVTSTTRTRGADDEALRSDVFRVLAINGWPQRLSQICARLRIDLGCSPRVARVLQRMRGTLRDDEVEYVGGSVQGWRAVGLLGEDEIDREIGRAVQDAWPRRGQED